MNKTKILIPMALATLLSVGTLSGCGKEEPKDERLFGFSISLLSGKNQIELGSTGEKLVVNDNGVKTDNRSYQFKSDNPAVATVNSDGTIIPLSEGKVNFSCTELSEGLSSALPYTVNIVKSSEKSEGGFNFSAQADTTTRTKILGALEKYAMDKKLTGITLFDNGGYVQYASRVKLPTTEYITGYGFGLLREGYLDGELPNKNVSEPSFYHSAISQDPLTINAMNASGSQVSDLSSYITSSYWGNRMYTDPVTQKKSYEWYPVLAKDKVYRPTVADDGSVSYAAELSDNLRPIPMEKHNDLNLYKKWRIYLKTGASVDKEGHKLEYRYAGSDNAKKLSELANLDGRKVALEDYEYSYKFILTGKNGQSRGAEMAGDTTYGIKGAQKYFNATRDADSMEKVDKAWKDFKAGGGLAIGTDEKGQEYMDLELVNAIDDFTAMYSLSSALVSPMPEDFITGIGKLGEANPDKIVPMFKAGEKIGAFNSGGDNAILDYTINCGPYYLSKWIKRQQIIFSRNDNWFERQANSDIYRIPGIVNEVIDTSTDVEAVWKQFKDDGALDVAGVPTQKVETEAAKSLMTKGDSTFKLNVNSCTQEQWDYNFGPNGKIKKNSNWNLKPWMSNMNFLNGLFFSINRPEFAAKRGVQPSVNYFSDAYLDDPISGHSYNATPEHQEAIANYHSVRNGVDNFGYDYDKAVGYFRSAVNELKKSGAMQNGTLDNPNVYHIHIRWMYQTDIKEYGEDIKHYFEAAFNDPAVSGGLIKLQVDQDAVTNWEDVYDEWMMKGQYDLAFGAISGNTYNPLNFLEVLKSDNSSTFTLNYGADTSIVDGINPIIFDNQKWSFDGLWEAADHGGIIKEGVKVKPVEKCYRGLDYNLAHDAAVNNLFEGYTTEIPVQFANVSGVEFGFSRLECYIPGAGYHTFKNAKLSDDKKKILLTVDATEAKEINDLIFETAIKPDWENIQKDHPELINPFLRDKYGEYYSYEFYFTMKLSDKAPLSETYCEVKKSQNDKD